ncbi:MAG: putative lipoprotein YfhM [Chloroflexi bacterium]|nr:putative lipoprotein YfhM [Chloroflexota bacterium]
MNKHTHLSRTQRLLPLLAVILLLSNTLACALTDYLSGEKTAQPTPDEQSIPLDQTDSDSGTAPMTSESIPGSGDEDGEGLNILLSEGGAQPQDFLPLTVTEGEPLTEAEMAPILARLPVLTPEEDDEAQFRLPEEVLPPPPPPPPIEETFPVSDGEGDSEGVPTEQTEPLEVLRYSPEGEIPIAPFVNVTFNQPMVPLTTVESLAEEDIPVQIAPELSGTWRWLGTKTLNFQYDSEKIDRLPMATEYTVTVPAGIESATGNALEESIVFTFNTPPPTVVSTYPHSATPQPLDPVFFVAFDQRIDPEAVLATIQVTADGQAVEIELLSAEEIEAEKTLLNKAENAGEGRWLAFRAKEKLPKDAGISVTIGPGTPSAEGPLLTQSAHVYSFRTYAPLEIVDHDCSWYDDNCPPLTPFYIEFNNPLDPESYTEGTLSIEPEIPGASVNIYGDTLQIQGMTEGRTTYRVTVDGEIQDIFGQKLGKEETLKFKVGPAESILIGPQKTFITLDPSSSKPSLSLYTINYKKLDVKIYAVEPSDWSKFKQYLQEYQRTDEGIDPPGKLVLDETQRLDTPKDTLTEIGISLSEVMDGDYGHFIIIAKPHRGLLEKDKYWETVQAWVQVTQIGLDAFVDSGEMVAWATNLRDGVPLEDVAISSDAAGISATTGEDGTAKFDIPSAGATYLTAQQGEDVAMLPASTSFWEGEGWHRRSQSDDLRWYVFDDRQMYRPGEEVHVKGWMRRIEGEEGGDVALVGDSLRAVTYQVIGPQGNEYSSGQVEANALGGFDLSFTLPENANLGYASLQLDALGSLNVNSTQYYHNFQIQEFRRPEFEVTARNETTGPYFVGDSATMAVEAAYYAGGPLPNAETNWFVTSSATNYNPPNWPDFTFGTWTPWWYYYWGGNGQTETESGQSFSSYTDATGQHYLKLDFESTSQPRPHSVLAQATVFDVNRQAWSGSTSLMVHPAELYVGLRSERYFVEQGEDLDIDLIVTDLDGEPAPDRPIHVEAARLEWKYTDGRWGQEEVDIQTCQTGSRAEPVTCSFETFVGGRYTITATITDGKGRENQSQITRWVSGGQRPPSRTVEQETVTLIPNQEDYQPGDVAEILVQSPFSPAEGLLTISRSGILSTERFTLDDGSATLEIPITEEYIPNLHVQVDLVGSAPRTDDSGEIISDSEGVPTDDGEGVPTDDGEGVPTEPRPAYATGTLTLTIPPLERTLSLAVTAQDEKLEPGGETQLDILLTDADGEPVPDAELAAVVVDEAILALSNYTLVDPISVFYQLRPSGFSSYYSRSSIILANPQDLAEQAQDESRDALEKSVVLEGEVMEEAEMMAEAPASEPALDMAEGESGPAAEAITIRTDFNPLATFAPETRTDEEGRATVDVSLPDNLTRYRVMVVAVDASGKQFGSAEANITARLPLMVRPSAPRFLNFGDQFELPVVIQNQTDEDMEAEVVIQTTNLTLTDEVGQRVTVPANDRVEVRFPAQAEMAGTARFQIAGVSGSYADAASGELPVYTPATTEAFATYGVVDEDEAAQRAVVAQPVAAPEGVFPQFGGLEINTSSTALQALTDAVLYLVSYPYDCSEQMASRVLGVAALRDVLTAFEADGLPSAEDMESAVARDIEMLGILQNHDGGFPYWRRGRDSIPFNTIHVAHALQKAKLKGYEVPQGMQEQTLYYLQDIESHYPYWYSQSTRWTLSSYALYVRDLMGDPDTAKARNLLEEAGVENLSLDAVGWLWSVLTDDPNSISELEEIRLYVNNRVVETAGAANFTIGYDDQNYLLLRSNRRTDAILLDALIGDNPESDLIPKVVKGLLAHRTKGRWYNTQENVFVLLALDRYFKAFESQTPDFVARIWLGETYAGSHTYEGYSTEGHETEIPMNYLMDSSTGPSTSSGQSQNLILEKEGTGRLYYRLGLKYAPTDLNLEPLDMGFVILREYEAVDDPEDVTRDEDGVWHIKAGARVRVRITMVADNRRYHVALVDPLPAGLEIVNPALAVSGSVPQDPNDSSYRYGWWWWGTWYQHQNMRDERAEAFTTLLWDGVYTYTYVARATTPGTFVVPPAKAEEMYSPEVFGRSGSNVVIVGD